MQIFISVFLFFIIAGCATVEVTKEIIKVSKTVQTSVSQKIPSDEKKITDIEADDLKKLNLEKEKKAIKEEQEKQKKIIKTQQKFSDINFIGKTIDQVTNKIGEPQLSRLDDPTSMLRYDTSNCRLFIFLSNQKNINRVEYFEIRNNLGELLNTKESLEKCYREFNLIG